MYRGGQKRVKEIKTKEQKNAETLGALYIYIYISVLYATSGIHLLDSNLEKNSFFCDAKKEAYIFEKVEIINRYINKTDYQKALEGFTKTGKTLETDLKTVPEFHSLMPIDSLFFR